MGLPMAKALMKAGFLVKGFDVRPTGDFGDFEGQMVFSAIEFSADVDVLISVVRDQQQTLDLYFEKQAVFRQPTYPKVCLLASTVSPRFLEALIPMLPDDVQFFDIPMSGAPIAAEEERLAFMVGADEESAQSIRPLLEAMGRDLHFLGGVTLGMTCKVLNNFVAASSVVAVRQVLDEAARLKLDPVQLLDVMKSSSGGTWFGDNFENIVWAKENYGPANTIGIVEKDVNALLDTLNGGQSEPQAIEYMKVIRDRLSTLPAPPQDKR